MASIVPTCVCNNPRDLIFTVEQTGPAPIGGYWVRWRIVDASGNFGAWSDWKVFYTSTFTLSGVPACCKIDGELKSSCGVGSDGTPRFSETRTWDKAASVTVSNITFSPVLDSCNTQEGTAAFTVQGVPGQVIRARLSMGGNVTQDTTVMSGSCAWLYGQLSARTTTKTEVSSTLQYGMTGTIQLPETLEITFTIPPSGTSVPTALTTATITTRLWAFNVANPQNLIAELRILSVDGNTVSNLVYAVPCISPKTGVGCAPSPDGITP